MGKRQSRHHKSRPYLPANRDSNVAAGRAIENPSEDFPECSATHQGTTFDFPTRRYEILTKHVLICIIFSGDFMSFAAKIVFHALAVLAGSFGIVEGIMLAERVALIQKNDAAHELVYCLVIAVAVLTQPRLSQQHRQ
jgi:hypothetical protein